MLNSYITLSFLLIWNWIDKYVHAFPYSLESHYRIQTKLEACAKTIPFGAAHTYKVNIREYPPPPNGFEIKHHWL